MEVEPVAGNVNGHRELEYQGFQFTNCHSIAIQLAIVSCQWSSKAEISRLEHAESLKPMLNSTHLEEKHEGGVEGGEGGEETHGGTPDITHGAKITFI